MDVVFLSRVQFAMTIMFHYLFPPLTIGLGVVMVYLEAMFLWTREPGYHAAARFWTRIFALNFAIGVATGIVMEFEFGTNWSTYSRFVGDVFGSALAAEGIFAFFLESGFLAVLVFGWNRVGPKTHFFATCMVSLGSMFSSVWIVVANSWQQTPAGHEIVPMMRDGAPWVVDGQTIMRAEITDFWAMVFNPSTVHRLTHVLIGCFIMGAFFVMSISAWYVLRGRHVDFARRSLTGALLLGMLASYASLVSGHFQSQNVYRTQPAKMAAFEGHFTTGPADMTIIGLPSQDGPSPFSLSWPGGLSWLLRHDTTAEIVGLDRFRPEDRPPVRLAFISYRLMIAIGTGFIALTTVAMVLRVFGDLFRHRWLMWLLVLGVFPAIVANQAGWVAAEVGRQPWIVHAPVHWAGDDVAVGPAGTVEYDESLGLRTTAGVSRVITEQQVLGSIIMFGLMYLLLAAVWIYVLDQKIRHGPDDPAGPAGPNSGFLDVASRRPGHGESLMG